jgi:hypothetical protein
MGPRGDVKELCRLQDVYFVPFPLLDDAGSPRAQLERLIRRRISRHAKPAGNHVQDLVAIGVNFAPMGRVVFHRDDADRHSIDPFGRTGCSFSRRHR